MEKLRNLLVRLAVLLAMLSLSGCMSYRYEHGDRINTYEDHDVGWCLAHAHSAHCLSAREPAGTASVRQ